MDRMDHGRIVMDQAAQNLLAAKQRGDIEDADKIIKILTAGHDEWQAGLNDRLRAYGLAHLATDAE